MGITFADARAYRAAKKRGTSFERTMTLGHQQLFLHRKEAGALREEFRGSRGEWPASLAGYKWGCYADQFLLEFLDISTLAIVDGSPYEGANMIHDMNEPIPDEWRNQFDSVIDCGSLEHIFNVPVALRNLTSMLTVGGTLFITTPANNLMGHGFYQFSPELMFRVFCEENGFTIRSLTVREAVFPSVELTRTRKVYSVADPRDVGKRVGLMSKRPAMMYVEAVKLAEVPVFARSPVQSEYQAAWDSTTPAPPEPIIRRAARRGLELLPQPVAAQIFGRYERRQFSLRNGVFYQRISSRSR